MSIKCLQTNINVNNMLDNIDINRYDDYTTCNSFAKREDAL